MDTTTRQPTARRTSVYTLRFLDREQVQQAADALAVPINDRGDFAVSWRDRCDADAIRHADAALAGAGLQDTPGILLTTGLGIHRRVVATI